MRGATLAVAAALAMAAGCATGTPPGSGAPVSPAMPGGAAATHAPGTLHPAGPVAPLAGGRGCPAAQARPNLLSLGPGALTGVQFVSQRQGWLVGLDRILFTRDGGRRWTVQDHGRLQLTSVDFTDAWHGWAVGASTLLATTDGGTHWRALPEPCPVIRAVHFVSPSVGFAIAGGTSVGPFAGLLVPGRGGVVLATGDGGRTWRRLPAPAGAQSVCFNTAHRGWLGAAGHLYTTGDGGRTWALAAAGPRSPWASRPYVMIVQCASADTAWGLDIGPGGEASQHPHVGYHASPAGAVPIFAEGYFSYPGISVHAPAPGDYPGPFSAISPSTAIYAGWCPACGTTTQVPWDLATRGGTVLRRDGDVAGLTLAYAAAFLTPAVGWITGDQVDFRTHRQHQRMVSTTDGGRTWRIDYTVTP